MSGLETSYVVSKLITNETRDKVRYAAKCVVAAMLILAAILFLYDTAFPDVQYHTVRSQSSDYCPDHGFTEYFLDPRLKQILEDVDPIYMEGTGYSIYSDENYVSRRRIMDKFYHGDDTFADAVWRLIERPFSDLGCRYVGFFCYNYYVKLPEFITEVGDTYEAFIQSTARLFFERKLKVSPHDIPRDLGEATVFYLIMLLFGLSVLIGLCVLTEAYWQYWKYFLCSTLIMHFIGGETNWFSEQASAHPILFWTGFVIVNYTLADVIIPVVWWIFTRELPAVLYGGWKLVRYPKLLLLLVVAARITFVKAIDATTAKNIIRWAVLFAGPRWLARLALWIVTINYVYVAMWLIAFVILRDVIITLFIPVLVYEAPRTRRLRRAIREVRVDDTPGNTFVPDGHTHPISAMHRDRLSHYLDDVRVRSGHRGQFYSVGQGNDVDDGLDYLYSLKSKISSCFMFIFSRTLTTVVPFDLVLRGIKNPWFKFFNSDYYMDPTKLFWLFKPISIVSHDVVRTADQAHDYTYTIETNELHQTASGGSEFRHGVNRYDTDVMASDVVGPGWLDPILRCILFICGLRLLFVYDCHYFHYNDYTVVHLTPRQILNLIELDLTFGTVAKLRKLTTTYNTAIGKINAQAVQECDGQLQSRELYLSLPGSDTHYRVKLNSFLLLEVEKFGEEKYTAANAQQMLSNVGREADAAAVRKMILALVPFREKIAAELYKRAQIPKVREDPHTGQLSYDFSPSSRKAYTPRFKPLQGLLPPGVLVDMDQPAGLNLKRYVTKLTKRQRKQQYDAFSVWMAKYGGNFSHYANHPGQTPAGVDELNAMIQCFPLLVKTPITVPRRLKGYGTKDAVLGRLIAINREDDALRATPVDWDIFTTLAQLLFSPVTPLSDQQLEDHVLANKQLLERMDTVNLNALSADTIDAVETFSNNFIKLELQMKAPDETVYRNITNDADPLVISLTRYTKPIVEFLTRFRSYAFGHSNAENGETIHDNSNRKPFRIETDYSAFDGTQNILTWFIECIVYRTFYPGNDNVLKLKLRSFNAKIKSANFYYRTYGSRHSGAADTSLMNTVVNIMVTLYAQVKHANLTAADLTVDVVHEMMSNIIAGGDDGIVWCDDLSFAATYEKVVKDLGLTIKASSEPSTAPVNFLSRIYPCPKASPGSGVDIKRLLCKFTHCQANKPALVGLALKTLGYTVMDYATPLVSDWLSCLTSLLIPLIDTEDVGRFYTADDVPYSARAGQPIPVTTPDDYLLANDPEAVESMQQSLKEFQQLIAEEKTLLYWVPSSYKPEDVGTYCNDTVQTQAINASFLKLNKNNELPADFYDSLPKEVKVWVANTSVVSKLEECLRTFSPGPDQDGNPKPPFERFLDVTPGPGGLSRMYQRLGMETLVAYHDADEATRFGQNFAQTGSQVVISNYNENEVLDFDPQACLIDLPWNMKEYRKTLWRMAEHFLREGVRPFIMISEHNLTGSLKDVSRWGFEKLQLSPTCWLLYLPPKLPIPKVANGYAKPKAIDPNAFVKFELDPSPESPTRETPSQLPTRGNPVMEDIVAVAKKETQTYLHGEGVLPQAVGSAQKRLDEVEVQMKNPVRGKGVPKTVPASVSNPKGFNKHSVRAAVNKQQTASKSVAVGGKSVKAVAPQSVAINISEREVPHSQKHLHRRGTRREEHRKETAERKSDPKGKVESGKTNRPKEDNTAHSSLPNKQ